MSNSYGRQVVEVLTNKSGGGVIAGDVVIVDTGNDAAFTTTTTGAYTGTVGVAQETIANNGAGRVLMSGYCALVNVNASVTRGNYAKTYTVAKQGTDAGSSRVVGAFAQFLTGGTTPTAHLFGLVDGNGPGGAVATDTIWDAAGDLAVGSGADTAARLPIGAAGGAVSRINGVVAWNSGTAFPTAVTGDRYWRTDLGLLCYYDGTRWLSVHQYSLPWTPRAVVATGLTVTTTLANAPVRQDFDVYITRIDSTKFVSGGTALSASHKWVTTFNKINVNNAKTAIATLTLDAGTLSTHIPQSAVLTEAVDRTTYFAYELIETKTGTPGSLFVEYEVKCRVIVT